MTQISTMQESEIKGALERIIKEMHPYYEDIKPVVFICGADKRQIIYIGANYDKFGKITMIDGQLVAKGEGIETRVDTMGEGIRTLVRSYFHIHYTTEGTESTSRHPSTRTQYEKEN